jgi:hypothetical protein
VVLTFSYSHASYIFVFIESHNSKSICCRVSVTMQLKSVLAARMHAVIAFIPPSLFSFPICIPHGSLLPIYCALSNIWGVAARSSSLYRPCCFHPIIPPPSILLSLSLYDVHPPSLPSIHPSIPFPFSCSVSLYFSLSLSLSLSFSLLLSFPPFSLLSLDSFPPLAARTSAAGGDSSWQALLLVAGNYVQVYNDL